MTNQSELELGDISKTTSKPVTVKVRRNINIAILTVLIATLLALVGLIIFIAVETSQSKIEGYDCGNAHEAYGLTSLAKIGNYTQLAVSADNKDCSTIGKNILERGGSAVDAAIAAGLCNSVMNAQSMGLGGGHFMVVYIKSTNKSYIIDARENAPMNAYRDMFVSRPEKSLIGGLATAIPGELYGYYKAHQLAGKLPWKDLFEPAIKLCEEGFKIAKALAQGLSQKEDFIKMNSGLREVFINPITNSVYKQNEVIKRLKYAQTLRNISLNGYELFYKGAMTKIIVDEINRNGGNVTIEDFNRYEPRVYEDRFMIRLDEHYRLYTVPPPSSGVLVSSIMRIMKGFNLGDYNKMTDQSWNEFYHRLAETLKHIYSKRTQFGDEKFVDMTGILNEITDQKYIDAIIKKIDDTRTFPESYYGSANKINEFGTAHISVLAPNGDAVSLTSTINNYFGAKYAGDETGIIYADLMDDFSTPGLTNSFGFVPSEANFIAPGKRPLSSMSPIIIVDNNNQVQLVLGASGGSKIISAVAQVAIKALWMGMNIKAATDDRRIHHQLNPNEVQLEQDFPSGPAKYLKKIGHRSSCFSFGGSTIQGIQLFGKNILAYADPRKGGFPDGV